MERNIIVEIEKVTYFLWMEDFFETLGKNLSPKKRKYEIDKMSVRV